MTTALEATMYAPEEAIDRLTDASKRLAVERDSLRAVANHLALELHDAQMVLLDAGLVEVEVSVGPQEGTEAELVFLRDIAHDRRVDDEDFKQIVRITLGSGFTLAVAARRLAMTEAQLIRRLESIPEEHQP